MKKIISGLCAISIFFSTGIAFVSYETTIRAEKVIPINFIADNEEILESIDLSEYKDAKIIEYEMTKGKAILKIKEEELILDLYEGNYFNGVTTQEKIKTEYIEDLILQNNKAIFMPEEKIKRIIDIEGDFESGIINNDKVQLELKKDATGISGYNKEKIVKSNISIQVPKNNSKETVSSELYKLHEMPEDGNIRLKNVNLDGKATLEIEKNNISILFTEGIPKIAETVKKDGYGYYWVDRAIDGTFREKYPNSIYRSDRYYFGGYGEEVDDERLIIERNFDDCWDNYVGFILGDQKYVYLLSDIPEKLFEGAIILNEKYNTFSATSLTEQNKLNWYNTNKLTVEITDDSVIYIPEGNLYSMGELVEGTKGWGEIMPNKNDESTESFYNDITGRMETYVRHFKFFYGPKEKQTFGGTVTYPYEATLEYEHYKPETLYNGTITYVYEEVVEDKGYEFNGWVKISYIQSKEINDYPPDPPYNVIYNNTNGTLSWQPATDDYTKSNEMSYEVAVKIGDTFEKVAITENGETKLEYLDGYKKKFRVRAKDNQNQFSEWAYSDESSIGIIGKVEPQEVFAGENIDIFATVKSLNNIESVQAYSDELNIDEELIKKSEKIPGGVEVTFNLLNNTGKEPWLMVDEMCYAILNDEDINVKKFGTDAETEGAVIDIELPSGILFNENGTVIFPNQNYMDIPSEITLMDDEFWYFNTMSGIYFKNLNTGEKEIFVQFINGTKATLIGRNDKIEVMPHVKINLFDYSNGEPTYLKIPVSTDIAIKPIAVTWETLENIIKFIVYVDGEEIYSYEITKENVLTNIKSFYSYSLKKKMNRMLKNSVGYCYHPNAKTYNWVDMYKSNSVLNIPWLGYKLNSKREVANYEKYNNLATTRDVNRLVFLNESISKNAINLYLSKIKSTNMMISKNDDETVFASKIQEKTGAYSADNVCLMEDIKPGKYDIIISAVDENGQIAQINVPLIIKEKANDKVNSNYKDKIRIGRFYYANNNINEKYIEELSLTKFNLETIGFISAGETLAIAIDYPNKVESITVDFVGDRSIKHVDKLTKKFLGQNLEYNFPLTLYPDENGIFVYKIPYGTNQTLESWSTLREKSGDAENINKSLLFSRIREPYQIKIKIEDEEVIYKFDVFERWDTILNRDASKYITNANQKWRMRL